MRITILVGYRITGGEAQTARLARRRYDKTDVNALMSISAYRSIKEKRRLKELGLEWDLAFKMLPPADGLEYEQAVVKSTMRWCLRERRAITLVTIGPETAKAFGLHLNCFHDLINHQWCNHLIKPHARMRRARITAFAAPNLKNQVAPAFNAIRNMR